MYINKSPARAQFMRQLGHANFNLNTTIVGLEAVKSGNAIKPADLAIGWDPTNRDAAAVQARAFVTSELLVFACDALDQYMRGLSSELSLIEDQNLRSVLIGEPQPIAARRANLTSDVARSFAAQLSTMANDPEEYRKLIRKFFDDFLERRKPKSIRERLRVLNGFYSAAPEIYVAAVCLLISWRNKHVHNANDSIDNVEREELKRGKQFLYENHAHCDIDVLLSNYDSGAAPRLKEISTLVSIIHRTVEEIDRKIIETSDIGNYASDCLIYNIKLLKNPKQKIKDYWGKGKNERIKKLEAFLVPGGFRKSRGESWKFAIELSTNFLDDFANLDRDQIFETASIGT